MTGAVALALAVLPAGASAATFKVKSTADSPASGSTSNASCVSQLPGGTCTFRAAIQEANGTAGFDKIDFGGSIRGQTITVNVGTHGELPDIVTGVRINGCSSKPNNAGPCIGLNGGGSFTALRVTADEVKLRGLAVTNADHGFRILEDASEGVVKNNWFGLQVTGANGSLANIGIVMRGDSTQIGGPAGASGSTPADRNVFANAPGGLLIENGGDNNVVQGNYFGTMANGQTLAPNVQNIAIGGTPRPSNNKIGGTVTGSAASSAKCDGVCNLIVGGDFGVDLGTFAPGANGVKIAGNHIGLSRTGSADQGNDFGIFVGQADNVTIGGSTSGARNYISGHDSTGILANDDDADGLKIQRNYIGLNRAGTAAVGNAAGAFGADIESAVAFNRNWMGSNGALGTEGLILGGNDPKTVNRNKIGVGKNGADVGFGNRGIVLNQSENASIGAPGAGNIVGHSGTGIQLQGGEQNVIRSNYVGTNANGADLGNDQVGIEVFGAAGFPGFAIDNTIGADISGGGNTVSFNGSACGLGDPCDGIRIEDVGNCNCVFNNRAFRNKGKKNGTFPGTHHFLDLQPNDGLGNNATTGPNHPPASPNAAIQAPEVDLQSNTKAVGTADSEAVVHVYRTRPSLNGTVQRVDAFLGKKIPNAFGDWTLTFPKLKPGQCVTATQTIAPVGTSEFPVLEQETTDCRQ